MGRLIFILSLMTGVLAGWAQASTETGEGGINLDGNWFSCEFAHSQIPPDDGCKMLDDDGFMISKGRIDHIKVTDSRQVNCRHQRLGQCFDRVRPKIVVSRDSVGPIRATTQGFAITYWGCTQEYKMRKRGPYFEIAPKGKSCLWTRDKRYFVARYQGRLEVVD